MGSQRVRRNLATDTFPFFSHTYGASQLAVPVKNLPANVGDARHMGSISGLGRSPGEGNSRLLQCSCLESSKDGGDW